MRSAVGACISVGMVWNSGLGRTPLSTLFTLSSKCKRGNQYDDAGVVSSSMTSVTIAKVDWGKESHHQRDLAL